MRRVADSLCTIGAPVLGVGVALAGLATPLAYTVRIPDLVMVSPVATSIALTVFFVAAALVVKTHHWFWQAPWFIVAVFLEMGRTNLSFAWHWNIGLIYLALAAALRFSKTWMLFDAYNDVRWVPYVIVAYALVVMTTFNSLACLVFAGVALVSLSVTLRRMWYALRLPERMTFIVGGAMLVASGLSWAQSNLTVSAFVTGEVLFHLGELVLFGTWLWHVLWRRTILPPVPSSAGAL